MSKKLRQELESMRLERDYYKTLVKDMASGKIDNCEERAHEALYAYGPQMWSDMGRKYPWESLEGDNTPYVIDRIGLPKLLEWIDQNGSSAVFEVSERIHREGPIYQIDNEPLRIIRRFRPHYDHPVKGTSRSCTTISWQELEPAYE